MQSLAQIWPLIVYSALVVVIAAVLAVGTHYLGERRHGRATEEPYESGMRPTGSARVRVPAEFYLIAMFFVIFDLETVFIVAWAIAMRELGWAGFYSVLLFIGILLVVLGYLWRVGALDWGARRGVRGR
jgi:NADH-quinone oxidoreductase subunit A